MEKKTPEKSVLMNMSRAIKEDLLPKLRIRYSQRGREGKSLMLDELCEDYGYERKYAIKLLSDRIPAPTGRPKPGPQPLYSSIEPIVRTIWLAAEQPCGKRLKPALMLWLPHYQRHYEKVSKPQRRLLSKISPATLDRLLAPARATYPGRGLSGTRPGSLLRTEIPVHTDTHLESARPQNLLVCYPFTIHRFRREHTCRLTQRVADIVIDASLLFCLVQHHTHPVHYLTTFFTGSKKSIA